MAISTTTPPAWHLLSHRDRYRRLSKVRRVWHRCHYGKSEDQSGRTVSLDGNWISDIPSFYLSLGEAINGPNGYFGGDLHALSDCLGGRFGVAPPLTIRLSHFDEVRSALNGQAWCRWHAEIVRRICVKGDDRDPVVYAGDLTDFVVAADHTRLLLVENGYLGDGSEEDVTRWTAIYEAALRGNPFDHSGFRSYFDAVAEIIEQGGAKLVPFGGEASFQAGAADAPV